MSNYPDDRYDGDRMDEERRFDHRDHERARAAVRVPATLLIVTGAFLFVGVVLNFIQLSDQPAKMDQAIADVDANPNMPKDQKDFVKNMYTSMKDFFESPAAPVIYSIVGVIAVLIIVGGVKLINLSGRGLPITASILAMIPCTSGCCCLLGLPAGIWALVVLGRPEVSAAIAANRSGARVNPDEQYMR